MTVSVRLFAELRERFGCQTCDVTLPDGGCIADLLSQLGERVPAARPLLAKSLTSIGTEYASPDCPLRDGQEVAVLPPVSGG
jgi:molybdopterin converting factor small subunit